MSIDREDIQKLLNLSIELEKQGQVPPATKFLINSLLSVTQHLYEKLSAFEEENSILLERIEQLEYAKKKSSSNSSIPPSLDPNRKRGKGHSDKKEDSQKRKQGGQSGHKGSTLKRSKNPDITHHYKLKGRCPCGKALSLLNNKTFEERQVFEVQIKKVVVSHKCELAYCSCGKKHTARFPEGISSSTQYGKSVRSFVSYLNQYQLIPFERTQEIMNDLFGLSLCKATVFNHNSKMKLGLNDFKLWAREELLKSSINHADESPTRVLKDRYHLHVLSNNQTTLIETFKSRGKAAVEMMGVIPRLKGYLVHDCYSMYFGYDVKDIICNAHLLRELEYFTTIDKYNWSKAMKDYLSELYDETRKLKSIGQKKRSYKEYSKIKREYRRILKQGKQELKGLVNKKGKKQEKVVNLYKRMKKYEDCILKFTQDFKIPFTNNQAERDLRMSKVHLKISGCFRSFESARYWSLMRSYISTLKKRNLNVWEGVKALQNTTDRTQIYSILSNAT